MSNVIQFRKKELDVLDRLNKIANKYVEEVKFIMHEYQHRDGSKTYIRENIEVCK